MAEAEASSFQESDEDDEYGHKPTLAECKRWCDVLDSEFGGLYTEQVYEEIVYYQAYPVDTREGVQPVKPGSAPADADAAGDSLVPSDMLIRVRPARNHEKYKKQAEKLAKFAMALWHTWRKNKDTLRLIAMDMVIRRLGVARVMVDDSLWPEMPSDMQEASKPKKSEDEDDESYGFRVEDWNDRRVAWETKHHRKLPIMLERRDPRCVKWRENTQGDLLVVVEKYTTTVLEAKDAWKQRPIIFDILAGKNDNDEIWVKDIWYGHYRCVLVCDEPIFPAGPDEEYKGVWLHPYSVIPYVIAPYRELGGDMPVDKYRGMLTNHADLYSAEAESMTMNQELLRWYAWPTYVGHTLDGRDFQIIPGLYMDLDKDGKGEYMEGLKTPQIPPELMQWAGTIGGYIQRNGVSNPGTANGARSAQQQIALNAEREKKLDAPRQSLQRLVTQATSLAAMELEENLDGTLVLPVPGHDRKGNDLGEVEISPKDVNGYWDGFEVNFSRRLDPALLAVGKDLMGMAQNNFLSQYTALALSGLVDNPQEELDNLLQQAIEKQPWLVGFMGLKQAEAYLGEDSEEFQIIKQQYMQSQQAKPGAGGPQGGGGQMADKPMQPVGGNRSIGTPPNTQDGFGGGIAQADQMGHARVGGRKK